MGGTTTNGKLDNILEVQRKKKFIKLKNLESLKEGDILMLSLYSTNRAVCIDPKIPSFIGVASNGDFRYIEYNEDISIKGNRIRGEAEEQRYDSNSGAGIVFSYIYQKAMRGKL